MEKTEFLYACDGNLAFTKIESVHLQTKAVFDKYGFIINLRNVEYDEDDELTSFTFETINAFPESSIEDLDRDIRARTVSLGLDCYMEDYQDL